MSRRRGRLGVAAVVLPLLALLAWVAVRAGPLAPVAVTAARVEVLPVRPALFGVGAVEARYTYRIGPTIAGRVRRLDVQVGDQVRPGQVLGEMDPVDLDDRLRAQEAMLKRAQAAVGEAQARQSFAAGQAQRYERLFAARAVSEESLNTRRQELQVADAALAAAREELSRARAEREAITAQRSHLRLSAPAGGIVAVRAADPGTTVVAGQPVVEVIDPGSLWLNVRFDQASAAGLAAGLPASVVLRSRDGQALAGRVVRVEPVADAVTEELLAKVAFSGVPAPLPQVGELAEVTVHLPAVPPAPVIPNAAVQRQGEQVGVWRIVDGAPRFVPVTLGRADLDGMVQVSSGLRAGDRVVVHSEKALGQGSRIKVVERLAGGSR